MTYADSHPSVSVELCGAFDSPFCANISSGEHDDCIHEATVAVLKGCPRMGITIIIFSAKAPTSMSSRPFQKVQPKPIGQ